MSERHVEGFTGTVDEHLVCFDKIDEPDETRFDFADTSHDPPTRFTIVWIDTPEDGFGPRVRAEGPYDEQTYLEMSGREVRFISLEDLATVDPHLSEITMRVGIDHAFSFDEIAGRIASLLLPARKT